jgi:hypothetical protein
MVACSRISSIRHQKLHLSSFSSHTVTLTTIDMQLSTLLVGLTAWAASANGQAPITPSEPAPEPPQPSLSTVNRPPVPAPTVTGSPGQGPICQCGYTYCATVLMAMSTYLIICRRCRQLNGVTTEAPWSVEALTEMYCSTENAICAEGAPSTNVTQALFICLCDDEADELGIDLDLVCGCQSCLNIGPDYRGRCKTPCVEG